MLPTFEVAHIVRQYGDRFIANKQPLGYHKKVLNAIAICRTAQLGGHVDACDKCSHTRISYNSCRNRHCPKCQSTEREKWIIARKEDLLPVSYYHVVFTIPEQLNPHCLQHPKAMYNILFDAAKETLFAFAADKKHLGASMGFIALLHTWGQNLSLHPHLHCIVPGGGITTAGQWKTTRSKGDFLFPIKQMSTVFKNKFMHKYRQWLHENNMQITNKLRQLLYQKNWVIYLKQPFGGPEQVVEYLGRYSHKIAISNHRLKSIADGSITFSYKDYKDGSKTKMMTLEADEFFEAVLYAYFTTSIYENKALWVFGK